ncbi:hypothetical protein B0H17DRAFT_1136981 [Mycena rosella]|uniref:Uncharacterized protein n=1 Tax=Mycena rosella TaxID=1033263 RepID=A0AAD7D9Y5_MYCRO|nr:hypothetical protein B0H17DRAFT_1136981 [Mycena rosella]
MSSLSPPMFTTVNYAAVAPSAPSEHSISLSDAAPRRSALKWMMSIFDTTIFDTAIFDTATSVLSDLELPEGCATHAIALASIESAPSLASSRWCLWRSSIWSVNSTTLTALSSTLSSLSFLNHSSLSSVTSIELNTSDVRSIFLHEGRQALTISGTHTQETVHYPVHPDDEETFKRESQVHQPLAHLKMSSRASCTAAHLLGGFKHITASFGQVFTLSSDSVPGDNMIQFQLWPVGTVAAAGLHFMGLGLASILQT